MGILAGNLATMRPLLQCMVANTTRLANSLRSRQSQNMGNHESKNRADSLPNDAAPSVAPLAAAYVGHCDHRHGELREDDFAFFRHSDAMDVEYGVHVWHGNSKEELVDVNRDVELGASIFQRSELIVREETKSGFSAIPKE